MPELIEQIKSELKRSQTEMTELVTKRDTEIAEMGVVSKATRDELAVATKNYEQVEADVTGLKAQFAEVQKSLGRGGLLSGDRRVVKSLGSRVIEAGLHKDIAEGRSRVSAEFNSGPFLGLKDERGNYLVNYMTDEEFAGPEAGKDALETMEHITASRFDGEGRRLIPAAYGGVIPYLERPLLLESFINTQPISTDAIDYVQETAPFDNLRTLTVDPVTAGANKTIKVDLAVGFFVGQPIQIRTADGEEEHRVSAVNYAESVNTITLSTTLGAAVPARSPITSRYFSGQIEGGLKPWSGFRQFESYTESIKTLAHAMPVTRQMLDDLPRLRSEIDSKLLQGMDSNREWQILYGNGDRRNLSGILTNPLRQTYKQSAGVRPDGSGDNKIDAVRRAITLSNVANVAPTSVLMNIFDWEEIEMMKDDDNRYLYSTVTEGGVQRLWRIPVVVSQTIEPGRAVMGNWRDGVTLHVRQGANIRFSEQHEDFFLRNLVAVLCEERVGLTVSRPQSFVDMEFDGPRD